MLELSSSTCNKHHYYPDHKTRDTDNDPAMKVSYMYDVTILQFLVTASTMKLNLVFLYQTALKWVITDRNHNEMKSLFQSGKNIIPKTRVK
jgi:hypothetical protein